MKKEKIGKLKLLGKYFKCNACGNYEFKVRDAQLNTAIASLLGLDWTNTTATCLVCDKCGYIHWFLPKYAEYVSEEEPFVLEGFDDPKDKPQV